MEQRSKMNRVEIEIFKEPQVEVRSDQNIELIYCLDGQLSVITQERTSILGPEDVLIVNANRNRHMLPSDSEVLYAIFTISYQLLGDVLHSLDIMYWCDSTGGDDTRYDELRQVLKELLGHYIRTSGNIANFRYIMLCYQLMDIITLHFLVQKRESTSLADEDQYVDRIRQINTYIHSNYAQLHDLVSEFWRITEPATIKVFRPGSLPAGDHDIDVKLMFHSPYMPISDTQYMPIDSCGRKTLTLAQF